MFSGPQGLLWVLPPHQDALVRGHGRVAAQSHTAAETGEVLEMAEVGGLHHRYERRAAEWDGYFTQTKFWRRTRHGIADGAQHGVAAVTPVLLHLRVEQENQSALASGEVRC
jgi:hypothetical protein